MWTLTFFYSTFIPTRNRLGGISKVVSQIYRTPEQQIAKNTLEGVFEDVLLFFFFLCIFSFERFKISTMQSMCTYTDTPDKDAWNLVGLWKTLSACISFQFLETLHPTSNCFNAQFDFSGLLHRAFHADPEFRFFPTTVKSREIVQALDIQELSQRIGQGIFVTSKRKEDARRCELLKRVDLSSDCYPSDW